MGWRALHTLPQPVPSPCHAMPCHVMLREGAYRLPRLDGSLGGSLGAAPASGLQRGHRGVRNLLRLHQVGVNVDHGRTLALPLSLGLTASCLGLDCTRGFACVWDQGRGVLQSSPRPWTARGTESGGWRCERDPRTLGHAQATEQLSPLGVGAVVVVLVMVG
jgi:hypothetical protein